MPGERPPPKLRTSMVEWCGRQTRVRLSPPPPERQNSSLAAPKRMQYSPLRMDGLPFRWGCHGFDGGTNARLNFVPIPHASLRSAINNCQTQKGITAAVYHVLRGDAERRGAVGAGSVTQIGAGQPASYCLTRRLALWDTSGVRRFLNHVWLGLELPANLWMLVIHPGVLFAMIRIAFCDKSRRHFIEGYRGRPASVEGQEEREG
jgi:hypothetical protein